MGLDEVMAGAEAIILENGFSLTHDSQRRRKIGVSSSRRHVMYYHGGNKLIYVRRGKRKSEPVLRIKLQAGAHDSSLDINEDGKVVPYQVERKYTDALSEMLKAAIGTSSEIPI